MITSIVQLIAFELSGELKCRPIGFSQFALTHGQLARYITNVLSTFSLEVIFHPNILLEIFSTQFIKTKCRSLNTLKLSQGTRKLNNYECLTKKECFGQYTGCQLRIKIVCDTKYTINHEQNELFRTLQKQPTRSRKETFNQIIGEASHFTKFIVQQQTLLHIRSKDRGDLKFVISTVLKVIMVEDNLVFRYKE